ncbi:uracil-DNA glycosylase, family 4 [Desulfocurvibacter africanus PCS]|uniref:Type-4 uracil-DNA glycosylase n=1 Tax=Desulfocurvibacter africanus PCS TaxID=1262666 RepID=M5PR01_DESAF|nr:uracil-DNA glycosylase [Desulfocurvibacter africanus]EMG36807.1 uracil-DNA glycosylase, family 4 [Desulfocurvibacter africanus PCS]
MSADLDSAQLAELAEGIRVCERCPLHLGRRNAVPGEGGFRLHCLLVGEAPGQREDEFGRPFIGRTGAFLGRFLAPFGLSRDDFFITSSVKCRPPGNRAPKPLEMDICRETWLLPQIEALKPRLIILMGNVPIRSLLGIQTPLSELHGKLLQHSGLSMLPTYHPTAAMRFPAVRRLAEADWETIRTLLRP